MIADDAAALSVTLGTTVYYGFAPDAETDTHEEVIMLRDFPVLRPRHVFGEDQPLMTPYGVEVYARASTQAAARVLCQQGYEALLEMGYLSLSPVVSLGRDDGGRFEAVAEVEAYSTS